MQREKPEQAHLRRDSLESTLTNSHTDTRHPIQFDTSTQKKNF